MNFVLLHVSTKLESFRIVENNFKTNNNVREVQSCTSMLSNSIPVRFRKSPARSASVTTSRVTGTTACCAQGRTTARACVASASVCPAGPVALVTAALAARPASHPRVARYAAAEAPASVAPASAPRMNRDSSTAADIARSARSVTCYLCLRDNVIGVGVKILGM